ncbi:MAG: hypothetical protein Q7S32_02690 [bacterium]|nr:hypothetical protein [bacterium]
MKNKLLALVLLLGLGAVFLVPSAEAANSEVVLNNTSQTLSAISGSQTTELFATFTNNSVTESTVLIDLEIWHIAAYGVKKVQQSFWDSQTFAPGESKTFSITSAPANTLSSGGFYALSVGVFNSGWNGLLHWHKQQNNFTVTNSHPGNEVTIARSALTLKSIEAPDQTTQLSAAITNKGSTMVNVLVDIELWHVTSSGRFKVAQTYTDNVSLVEGEQKTFTLDSPSTLSSEGFYGYSVGIFNPGWNGVLQWNHDQEVFTVTPAGARGSETIILSSSQTSSTISAGQTNTLTARVANLGAASSDVLADLEIYNSANQKVDQRFVDHVAVPAGAHQDISITTSPTLPPGNYYFSAGIFAPSWGNLMGWHNKLQQFTVQ